MGNARGSGGLGDDAGAGGLDGIEFLPAGFEQNSDKVDHRE